MTLKQKHGCPIGGTLSSFYANIYCAWREYLFIKQYEVNGHYRIHGIRQVDDLIMWVSFNKQDPNSEREANTIIKILLDTDTKQSRVYEDGLTLTEETVTKIKKQGTLMFRTDFAELS